MKRVLSMTLVAGCLLLGGPSRADDATTAKLTAGNTAFALDLYRQLRASKKGNLFYSPYSISTALAMTFAGGLIFGWVYAVRGNFPAAVILHSLGGQIVFTSGLGILFYSGAVA